MAKRTSTHGVQFYRDTEGARASVHVDASAHTIRLHDEANGERLELGALRTALVTAMGFIGRALSVEAFERDLSPIGEAIVAALQRCAGPLRDASLEAAIAEVHPTPLLYSSAFLESKWLWADAFRFRACRVAVAHAEDLVIDEDSPESAANVVARLGKWRDLFLCEGGGKKAINTALNDYGETMPSTPLWGLRNVVLKRPRTAQAPLEILGWLGSIHGTPASVIALAEGAADDELCALLDGCSARVVASLLAQGDQESRTFAQLVKSAESESVHDATAFARPPIALPDVKGLRFVENAKQLEQEGEQMHHCVAGLRSNCKRGLSFVFHAERDGTHGTIHVSDSGNVVEARGPFNRASTAASWGAETLAAWGAGLWVKMAPPETLAWSPMLDCPPGGNALRSVRALSQAFETLSERKPEKRTALAHWFRRTTMSAVNGAIGVYWKPGDLDRVWTVSIGGQIASSDVDPRSVPVVYGRRMGIDALGHVPIGFYRPPQPPRPPPIAPPKVMGIEHLSDDDLHRAVAAIEQRAQRVEPVANHWYFRCHPDAGGTAVMDVDIDGNVVIVATNLARDRAERFRARLAAWAGGFWGPRLGMDRSTWSTLRAPSPLPPKAEPLTTVAACHLLYTSTCDKRLDADLALARFYTRHVDAAIRGQAWLLVRDRAVGLVSVVDAKRNVIGRSDEIVIGAQAPSRAHPR